ncbi:hypothetical protein PLESTM_000178100 [Pleodorina starrii]|nr:hypothetical protein PLESTM_000178100 [Pleodorina starrii]
MLHNGSDAAVASRADHAVDAPASCRALAGAKPSTNDAGSDARTRSDTHSTASPIRQRLPVRAILLLRWRAVLPRLCRFAIVAVVLRIWLGLLRCFWGMRVAVVHMRARAVEWRRRRRRPSDDASGEASEPEDAGRPAATAVSASDDPQEPELILWREFSPTQYMPALPLPWRLLMGLFRHQMVCRPSNDCSLGLQGWRRGLLDRWELKFPVLTIFDAPGRAAPGEGFTEWPLFDIFKIDLRGMSAWEEYTAALGHGERCKVRQRLKAFNSFQSKGRMTCQVVRLGPEAFGPAPPPSAVAASAASAADPVSAATAATTVTAAATIPASRPGATPSNAQSNAAMGGADVVAAAVTATAAQQLAAPSRLPAPTAAAADPSPFKTYSAAPVRDGAIARVPRRPQTPAPAGSPASDAAVAASLRYLSDGGAAATPPPPPAPPPPPSKAGPAGGASADSWGAGPEGREAGRPPWRDRAEDPHRDANRGRDERASSSGSGSSGSGSGSASDLQGSSSRSGRRGCASNSSTTTSSNSDEGASETSRSAAAAPWSPGLPPQEHPQPLQPKSLKHGKKRVGNSSVGNGGTAGAAAAPQLSFVTPGSVAEAEALLDQMWGLYEQTGTRNGFVECGREQFKRLVREAPGVQAVVVREGGSGSGPLLAFGLLLPQRESLQLLYAGLQYDNPLVRQSNCYFQVMFVAMQVALAHNQAINSRQQQQQQQQQVPAAAPIAASASSFAGDDDAAALRPAAGVAAATAPPPPPPSLGPRVGLIDFLDLGPGRRFVKEHLGAVGHPVSMYTRGIGPISRVLSYAMLSRYLDAKALVNDP